MPESKSEFGLKEILADNPFNISAEQLRDWLFVRKSKKAPITPSAWKSTKRVLGELQQAGLCPLTCFEKMVSSGWIGIQTSYFQKEIELLTKSNAQKTKRLDDERIAAEKRRQYEQEREGMKRIKAQIGRHVSIFDRLKQDGVRL